MLLPTWIQNWRFPCAVRLLYQASSSLPYGVSWESLRFDRFLRFASFRLGQPINVFDHDYGPVLRRFNFLTMQQRLELANLSFLFRIINGDINCPRLLGLINFSALSRPLRFTPLFRVKFFRTNIRQSDPITRVCLRGSEVADRINFFGSSLEAFRRSVIPSFGTSLA